MKAQKSHNTPAILDLRNYSIPKSKTSRTLFPRIYESLTQKKSTLPFDIFDFEMLFNDEPTNKIIREGKTIGCFYIESPGMRSLLQRLDCDTFEMLTAASSVIRPGVAESGMMQEFIARHKDPRRRKYLIPEMEKYLGETYGVMIYQEDVIKVAHHVAGLTLEEADLLRRGMSGKMRSHDAMNRVKDKFFSSCNKKKYSHNIAKKLWQQIESFAGYAFSKAHSASFALLSYQVAYLKVHYPAEFLAGVLSNGGGYYSTSVYIQEAKRMKLNLLLPSVNKSLYEYHGFNKGIQIGFMAIKNLNKSTADKIITERENFGRYVSLQDFLLRTKTGYEETALLIKCGALDCVGRTRPALMRLLDIYHRHNSLINGEMQDLFANELLELEDDVMTDVQYSIEEICSMEYEIFGYMVSRHPISFYENILAGMNLTNSQEIVKLNGKRVKMVGWFMASKRIKTRSGKIMKFLSLEDLHGTFEAVIFPEAYEKYAEKTMSMGPYLIEGKVDMENGRNIIVEKLEILSGVAVKAIAQKDSVENQYFGDKEKVNENEFQIVESLNKEKILTAYLN